MQFNSNGVSTSEMRRLPQTVPRARPKAKPFPLRHTIGRTDKLHFGDRDGFLSDALLHRPPSSLKSRPWRITLPLQSNQSEGLNRRFRRPAGGLPVWICIAHTMFEYDQVRLRFASWIILGSDINRRLRVDKTEDPKKPTGDGAAAICVRSFLPDLLNQVPFDQLGLFRFKSS